MLQNPSPSEIQKEPNSSPSKPGKAKRVSSPETFWAWSRSVPSSRMIGSRVRYTPANGSGCTGDSKASPCVIWVSSWVV